uniref:ORFL3L n=1 Tax=Tanapox virus TaxID=99000 RepID=Q9QQT2_9POXV|nr:ORFL3L [Tanapox virus]
MCRTSTYPFNLSVLITCTLMVFPDSSFDNFSAIFAFTEK